MANRRRGAALEAAILEAGWEQLLAEGYAGFTFEAIAERAKTGKAVLYRRWPDKEALLLAVLAHSGFEPPAEIPDTGSLREDVLILLRSGNRRGDHAAVLFSTFLSAYFNGELALTPAQLRAELFGDHSAALTQVIQQAVRRGELGPEPIAPRIVSLPADLLRHALIMNLGRVPDADIVDIVDTVFLPLVTAHRS